LEVKKQFPDSKISWITKPESVEILRLSPYINEILTLDVDSESLKSRLFDILYNFDIDEEATELANSIIANKKYGFYSSEGYAMAFNFPSEYYINTFFDDELKKANKKTYQEMMFEIAELPYEHQCHLFCLNEKDKKYAEDFVKENRINEAKLIGIHIGASSRWPSKVWHEQNLKEFIRKATKGGYEILLFGGPNEQEYHKRISGDLTREGIRIYQNNSNNTDKEFFSLIDKCRWVISGDTFALHASLALRKPTIGLFFCTSCNEIEDYGLLTKLVSPLLYDFFPEKSDQYSEELTKSISADRVLDCVKCFENSLYGQRVVNAIIRQSDSDKFLVIKKKEGIHAGKWAFPGGIIEKGETDEEALRREIKEEVGLEIRKILRRISNYLYSRPDGTNTEGGCFLIEASDFEVKINSEVEEFRWVSLEEFEKLDHVEGLEEEAFDSFYK
jgi:mutator protein MutT